MPKKKEPTTENLPQRSMKARPRKKERLIDPTRPTKDLLDPKDRLFVTAYIKNSGNGTRAYLTVNPHVAKSTATVEASRLLRNPNISAAIEEETKRHWKNRESEIEKEYTFQKVKNIAESDIADVVDIVNGNLIVRDLADIPAEIRGCIQSIKAVKTSKETKYGMDEAQMFEVKLYDKLRAIELMAKIQKMIDAKTEPGPIEIVVKPAVRPDRKK